MATRQRILVAALLLFNENGASKTTTNEIADEVDISPGNLHYHFRRKSDLVTALLEEFQVDAKHVLSVGDADSYTLDDFWVALHLLLECTASYRFLFRDMESIASEYPKVETTLQHFARGLVAWFELQLRALCDGQVLAIEESEFGPVSRNLVVITLMMERFDALVTRSSTRSSKGEVSALRVGSSVMSLLRPYVQDSAAGLLDELSMPYE